MALNDLNFLIHRRAPVGMWLMSVAATALVGMAVATGEAGLAILAILPAMIALMLLAYRPVQIEGRIGNEAIELIRPPMVIPFESIREIEAEFDPDEPLPDSFRIRVHHPRGVLKIPDAPDINSIGIYETLISRFQIGGSRAINPILVDYLVQHEQTFGPERVWSFQADAKRRKGADIHKPRVGSAVGMAILLTAVVWLVIAGLTSDGPIISPWWGFGSLALMIGLLTIAIAASSQQGTGVTGIKKWQWSSLVISPVGLAMVQGDIQGELAWDQLRDVKFKPNGGSFRLNHDANFHGITLVVEGARIKIADIYDRPLGLIHDRIVRYWNPDRHDSSVEL